MTDSTVIFASGLDGWAFTTETLAKAHSASFRDYAVDDLNEMVENCDKYWDKNSSTFCSGAQLKGCPNLFTQLGLIPIRSVYEKIVTKGDIKYGVEFLKNRGISLDQIKSIEMNPALIARLMLSIQFPLAACVVDQCYKVFPSPGKTTITKVVTCLSFIRLTYSRFD